MKKLNLYLLISIAFGVFVSLYFIQSFEFKNDEQLIVKYLSHPENLIEVLQLQTPNEGRGVNHSMLPTRFAGILTYFIFGNEISPINLRIMYSLIPILILFIFSNRIRQSKNKLFILFTIALALSNPYSLLIIRKLWTHGGPITMAGYLIIFLLFFTRKYQRDILLLGIFTWILVTLHTTAILYSISLSIVFLLYFSKNKNELSQFFYGSVIGLVISIQWILKVLRSLGESNNLLSSQGESAYWVLLFQYLKLENIKFDIGTEFFISSYMNEISIFAGGIVGILFVLNTASIISIKSKDFLLFIPFVLTGLLFIFSDLYLYPRYVVSFWPLVYLPLTVTMLPKYQRSQNRKSIIFLLSILVALNVFQSTLLFREIVQNPENIVGNIGKVYEICGVSADDARLCR